MILDLAGFIESERAYWEELSQTLQRMDLDAELRLTLDQVTRFHYLYQRCGADLVRIGSLSPRPEVFDYLEALVARAYSELHDAPQRSNVSVWRFLSHSFPQAFRRNIRAFVLCFLITIVSAGLGAVALALDYDSKSVMMPFSHLNITPAQRVKQEETAKFDRFAGHHSEFSAELMTHNIQVGVLTLALGMSWGLGTVVLLFYNGLTLGAVAFDYIHAGYTPFLLGWLLPHGVIEIPAILVAGQAGFVLAHALIGWGDDTPRAARLRFARADVFTLAGGFAVMLVWAGLIEAFFSQYHEPVLPYALKIAFGLAELSLLTLYLARAGRR